MSNETSHRPQNQIETPASTLVRMLSIQQFVRLYGISRAKAYVLLKSRELKAVKVGRRTYIPREEAELWARSLPSYAPEEDR